MVGRGGREHTLAWALSRSPLIDEVISAPGNPGMGALGDCVHIGQDDLAGIAALAVERRVDFVVVGPEAPLVAGLADVLGEKAIATFGPGPAGARLEGSKSFAKSLMRKYGIPTGKAVEFDRADEATAYIESLDSPVVIKADGLTEGKGVTVCDTPADAKVAIVDAMQKRRFGPSGARVLVEEKLEGRELSVLAFCDGKTVLAMPAARDYKRAFDKDRGPNTGGMGSYSPVPDATADLLDQVTDRVLEPISAGLDREGVTYQGVIYAGLVLTADGPKVLEFNCRFGDPEAQALLPRLESDLAEPLLACLDGSLAGVKLSWSPDSCVCVVGASNGYPIEYETGFVISGLAEAQAITGMPVFHAGTGTNARGETTTGGGRVLGVSALGPDLDSARRTAYRAMAEVSFDGIHYRRDIAYRADSQRGSSEAGSKWGSSQEG